MISKTMESALNKQINEELYSAYLYMSMSADFTDKNLNGFANWMTVQAKEEMKRVYGEQHYNYGLILNNLAYLIEGEGRYEEALVEVNQALAYTPDNPTLQVFQGVIYEILEQPEQGKSVESFGQQ